MFTFDIEKYKSEPTFNNEGLKCVICHCRKKHIYLTPEEKVRQAFIKYLVDEKGYLINKIEIEKPLSHFQKGTKGRADLVIYDLDSNPLILIEFKQEGHYFSDETLEQLISYSKTIDAYYYIFVIGEKVYFIEPLLDELGVFQKLVFRVEMPTYTQLVNDEAFEYSENIPQPYIRPSIKEPFSVEQINNYLDTIGEDTNCRFHSFIFNICGWLEDLNDILSFDNVKDIGQRITTLGGPMGGGFSGQYRSFEVALDNRRTIISFGIKASAKFENHKQYKNRKGYSYIMVAVENHFSLQLCIDKNVLLANDRAEIWHDGTITIGKIGQAKRQDLIDFVENHDKSLIKNGKIYLGQFILSHEINSQQEHTREFIKKTINYALLRDIFRTQKKEAAANTRFK